MNTLIGRIIFWLFTLSLIPCAWQLYSTMEDKGWARVIVGMCNSTNGIAFILMAQEYLRLKQKAK